MTEKKFISIAVNGGIGYGAKLTPRQLFVIAKYLEEDIEIELTTLQQLIVKVPEDQLDAVKNEFEKVGLSTYKVGPYVKNVRTCGFCQGAVPEGMPIARELNKRIAGQEVPFTLKVAFSGCTSGCGEPLVNDIGIIKRDDFYEVYVGGKGTGTEPRIGKLLKEKLDAEQLYDLVDSLIESYRKNGKKRERFAKFVDRVGM